MRFYLFPVAIAAALLLPGCGSDGDRDVTPAACLTGPKAYVKALETAPDPVLIGGVPITDCLPVEAKAGDQANVGMSLVLAATALNAEARKDPRGKATFALGYLLGTVRDAGGSTGGIYADLIRRVDVAAHYSPGGEPLPPAFGIGLARGEAATPESD